VLDNTRKEKTNKKNDNKNKLDTKDKVNNMKEPIGENTFLKLRQERDQARDECEKVKIQRDIALRKLNKSLEISKQLRKIIET
jgi:hypothetical protein